MLEGGVGVVEHGDADKMTVFDMRHVERLDFRAHSFQTNPCDCVDDGWGELVVLSQFKALELGSDS